MVVISGKTGVGVRGWWRRWWQQPDQFEWFSVYIHNRGLQKQWRVTTFLFTVALGSIPVVLLASPFGPNTTPTRFGAIAASVCLCAVSTIWLIRWPTRTQSLAFNATCCVCTAAGCLAVSNPYSGLLGCAIFAVIGGFLAYFHALAQVLANFAVAIGCMAITATRLLWDTGDVALVVASLLLVLGLNTGMPFGINSLVHALHADLRDSDHDPLTGLLNRRSFYNSVGELILTLQGLGIRLNVTVIDLDKFKALNDSKGHAVGDAALVSVAEVLRQNGGPGTVFGRLGGEEFVIADSDLASRHAVTVERIRAGIAATPFGITASLGTCSVSGAAAQTFEHRNLVDRLIVEADAAMYRSKRAGGDRVAHDHLDAGELC